MHYPFEVIDDSVEEPYSSFSTHLQFILVRVFASEFIYSVFMLTNYLALLCFALSSFDRILDVLLLRIDLLLWSFV